MPHFENTCLYDILVLDDNQDAIDSLELSRSKFC